MQTSPQVFISEPVHSDADSQLMKFAHQLAITHGVVPITVRDTVEISLSKKSDLLEYLKAWEQALGNANALFKIAPSDDLPVSHAGEWMLDNFYIVKQTFRQIKEDLPQSFFKQLPKLDGTSLLGHTRVFALAREWIEYNQSQIDLNQTSTFIIAYQDVMPLTIGELWALPIMLRIGILEQLVYAATELTGMEAPKGLKQIVNEAASPLPANETIVANCFLSLRLLASTDWKDFFEQTSRVEKILRNDPANIYAGMDFKTRNSYRSVIEELARHSTFTEEEVALSAVEFARSVDENTPGRESHIGFYLLDKGRARLEKSIDCRLEFRVRARRAILALPTLAYLGSIAFLSLLAVPHNLL